MLSPMSLRLQDPRFGWTVDLDARAENIAAPFIPSTAPIRARSIPPAQAHSSITPAPVPTPNRLLTLRPMRTRYVQQRCFLYRLQPRICRLNPGPSGRGVSGAWSRGYTWRNERGSMSPICRRRVWRTIRVVEMRSRVVCEVGICRGQKD